MINQKKKKKSSLIFLFMTIFDDVNVLLKYYFI